MVREIKSVYWVYRHHQKGIIMGKYSEHEKGDFTFNLLHCQYPLIETKLKIFVCSLTSPRNILFNNSEDSSIIWSNVH